LNERIIPAFKFLPKEPLLGLVVNTIPNTATDASIAPSTSDVNIHMVYVEQQQLDDANQATAHTTRWKAVFDKRVVQSHAGEVMFEPGQLVQVYANTLDMTVSNTRKLTLKWLAPRRIISKLGNSYTLTSLKGFPLHGLFHAQCLCWFILQDSTELATLQVMLLSEEVESNTEADGVWANIQEEMEHLEQALETRDEDNEDGEDGEEEQGDG
jgi:hypothetical protein